MEFRLFSGLRNALGSINFRRLLMAVAAWNFAVGVGGPFFTPHALAYLHLSFSAVQFYGVIVTITVLATNRFWGRALDRFGARSILVTCGMILGIFPVIWAFTGPGTEWMIWPEGLLAGIFWSAMNLALFAVPLAVSPKSSRPYAIALVAILSGVGYVGGSLGGGLIAEGVGGTSPLLGNWLTGFQLVLLLSGILRTLAALLFRRLEVHSVGYVRPLVAYLGMMGIRRPVYWVRGIFQRPNDEEDNGS